MKYSLLLALSPLAQPMSGQAATAIPDLVVGTRVRIETPAVHGKRVTGQLREVNQGYVAMSLGPHASIAVPWSRISSLSFVAGRKQGAGAATGAVVGVATSLVAYPASLVLLPAGAATIGWFYGPERWQPVSWRPTTDTVMLDGEATRLRLAPNAQVLVRTRRNPFKARAIEAGDDSLTLQAGSERLQLSWTDVSALSVREGRNRVKGAAMGFSLFAAAAAVRLSVGPGTTTGQKRDITLTSMLIGAVAGAIVGTTGWTRIPFPVE